MYAVLVVFGCDILEAVVVALVYTNAIFCVVVKCDVLED